MVDHMMTWWACAHRDALRKYTKVVVVSKDSGVYSLVLLLIENGINAEYQANID